MNEWIPVIPWLAMLCVFIGMGILQWRSISALSQALSLLSGKVVAPPAPVIRPAIPAPAALPPPATVNKPLPLPMPNIPVKVPLPPPALNVDSPFGSAPPWFQWALHEIGFHETGNNQGIDRYISLAHTGSPGDPWCAIFTNAALESCGFTGSRSPSSQSFRTNPNFLHLSGPSLGAIAVFWRGSPNSGLGHVGFYRGEDANNVWILGGNEDDMVQIEALAKSSSSFGLIGYWWPKTAPLPTSGVVRMPAGSATNVKVAPASKTSSDVQTDIVATMFGNQPSAYGGQITDNSPGVALPFHFSGQRPRVRVSNKKMGLTVDCDIVDVGPWNTNDPYWTSGNRPQAESGTDTTGRKTNKAGIDLTLAAAQAVQIDGKGLVDWAFIDPNLEAVAKALSPVTNVSLT